MTCIAREPEERERIATRVHPTRAAAATVLAAEIRALIATNRARSRPTVLGLATAATPVTLYRELIRLHREEGLSFRVVITVNLGEYFGLAAEHPKSYRRFMQEPLFAPVDIPAENIHIPSGTVPRSAITMGVGAILSARRIALLAWGWNKAEIVARAIEGPLTDTAVVRAVTWVSLTFGLAGGESLGTFERWPTS